MLQTRQKSTKRWRQLPVRKSGARLAATSHTLALCLRTQCCALLNSERGSATYKITDTHHPCFQRVNAPSFPLPSTSLQVKKAFLSVLFQRLNFPHIKFQAARKAKEKHSLYREYLTNKFSPNSQFCSVATFISTLNLNRKTDCEGWGW